MKQKEDPSVLDVSVMDESYRSIKKKKEMNMNLLENSCEEANLNSTILSEHDTLPCKKEDEQPLVEQTPPRLNKKIREINDTKTRRQFSPS